MLNSNFYTWINFKSQRKRKWLTIKFSPFQNSTCLLRGIKTREYFFLTPVDLNFTTKWACSKFAPKIATIFFCRLTHNCSADFPVDRCHFSGATLNFDLSFWLRWLVGRSSIFSSPHCQKKVNVTTICREKVFPPFLSGFITCSFGWFFRREFHAETLPMWVVDDSHASFDFRGTYFGEDVKIWGRTQRFAVGNSEKAKASWRVWKYPKIVFNEC